MLMKKIRLVFLTFLILPFLGLMGCHDSTPKNTTQWSLNTQCDLHHQTCTRHQDNQTVSLEITPHPIVVARPLGVQVALKNIHAQSVSLDISGTNMYMGFNRVKLMRRNTQHPHQWIGTTMLAFCTNNEMDWQITLLITQKNGHQIQVPYFLKTFRDQH